MKTTITILLFVISASAFGQDKIEGIGKFKLKKTTTSYLDTLVEEKDFDRVEIRSWGELFKLGKKEGKIAEVFPDTVNENSSIVYAHHCKDARVFYIPKMEISGIELIDTYLIFYKDTLVEIKTDYRSEITEAFELKYGKSKIDKKEKEVQCTLKLTGETVSYTDAIYYQYWTNKDIKCTAAIGDFRDSKCETITISYISISVEKMSEKIDECDNKEKERIKKKQETEKKKQLDGF